MSPLEFSVHLKVSEGGNLSCWRTSPPVWVQGCAEHAAACLIIHGARGDVGMMNAHPTSEGMPP
jgi:hypothetical protein